MGVIGFTKPLNTIIKAQKNTLTANAIEIEDLKKQITKINTTMKQKNQQLSENLKGKAIAVLLFKIDMPEDARKKVSESLYCLLENPLRHAMVKPDELNKLFWLAVEPLHRLNNLKIYTIGGRHYGASIDTALLTKSYSLPVGVPEAVLNAFCAAIAGRGEEAAISVSASNNSMQIKIIPSVSANCYSEICKAASALGLNAEIREDAIAINIPLG